MPAQRLVIDVKTGAQTMVDLTPEEIAGLDALAAESAAIDAKEADRADARRQLKAKAKNDQNLALIAKAMGIDLSA
jgi:hypothetical protein